MVTCQPASRFFYSMRSSFLWTHLTLEYSLLSFHLSTTEPQSSNWPNILGSAGIEHTSYGTDVDNGRPKWVLDFGREVADIVHIGLSYKILHKLRR